MGWKAEALRASYRNSVDVYTIGGLLPLKWSKCVPSNDLINLFKTIPQFSQSAAFTHCFH
jgi:hypothetical protein